MYAIIETGGKQYKVRAGDTVDVELLGSETGDTVELDQVLLVAGHGVTTVGTPTVEGAVVRATVVDEVKGDKVVVFKYKPKNRYRRKAGHRQRYVRLQIDEIVMPAADAGEAERGVVSHETPAVEVAELEAQELTATVIQEAVTEAEGAEEAENEEE